MADRVLSLAISLLKRKVDVGWEVFCARYGSAGSMATYVGSPKSHGLGRPPT
jgi:hypothetical protein